MPRPRHRASPSSGHRLWRPLRLGRWPRRSVLLPRQCLLRQLTTPPPMPRRESSGIRGTDRETSRGLARQLDHGRRERRPQSAGTLSSSSAVLTHPCIGQPQTSHSAAGPILAGPDLDLRWVGCSPPAAVLPYPLGQPLAQLGAAEGPLAEDPGDHPEGHALGQWAPQLAAAAGERRSEPTSLTAQTVVPAENNVGISGRTGSPATKEDVMHPVITQALAAERIRERQAYVVAAERARWVRRSPRARLFTRISRAPMPLPAARSLRGPKPA